MATKLTARQIEALKAGAKGNANAVRGTNMGGAKRRMIQRLVDQGLLTVEYPRRTTDAGNRVLVEAGN